MSSRSIVSASRLVLLAVMLLCAPAWAGKRVVVLDFTGPKADRFHDDIEAAIKKAKNTIVSVDDWNAKAEDMSATKVTSNNVMKVAHKLKVNGVVVGEVEKRGPRYYVHLRLREGATGEYVAEVEIVVRQAKLGDDGLKVVKDELLPAIKELSTAKGRDDGDDASSDDSGDEDSSSSKHGKKKKHGGFDRNSDDMDSDSGDSADSGDGDDASSDDSGDEDTSSSKHGKKKKDAKKTKKGHHDDIASDDEGDGGDDSGDEDSSSSKHGKKKDAKKTKKGHHDEDTDSDSGDGDSGDGDSGDGDSDGSDRTASADDGDGGDSGDSDHGDRDSGDVEAHAGPAIPSDWRTRAFDVGAGVSGTARRLTFETASGAAVTPQGYKGNIVAGARFDADLFPLAFNRKNHSITRHFGLSVAFDRVLKIQSKLDYKDMTGATQEAVLATTEQRYQAGLVYRAPVGDKMLVDASLKYDRMKFVIDKSAAPAGVTINIPNVDYTFVDPGVAVKYAASPKLLVGGGLGVGFVLNTGEMQQADQYGAATVLGIDADAGAAYYVTPNIVVRLDGRLTTFGFTFKGTGTASNPNGDMTVDVPKGRDTYMGGALTASYEY